MAPRLSSLLVALSLLVLLINSGASAASSKKNRCPAERESQMRVCAQQLTFLGDHSFKVPKNLTSVGPFCDELNKAVVCIQNYARECLTGFTRQLLASLMRRGKQQHSLICSSKASRLDFISKMSCLTDERIGKFHTLMDASITRFEFIASSQVQVEARLHSMCCSYQIFQRDLERTLADICGTPVQRRGSSNEYVDKIVGGTAGEFFGLICEAHRSMEECRSSKVTSSVLPRLEQVTAQVYSGQTGPKGRSLIPVLLEILESAA